MFYHFRALGVVNQCVPRTAPDGLKHLYDRNSPGNTANQNETKDKGGIEIDYELLLSNVENMLIADKARLFRREMKPKDLLVKSNPGLFGNMHPDITKWRKPMCPEKTIDLPQITDRIYRIIWNRVHLSMSGIRTRNVSGDRH
jgi:hypothetical protein